jgi:hypothetical protein
MSFFRLFGYKDRTESSALVKSRKFLRLVDHVLKGREKYLATVSPLGITPMRVVPSVM